VRALHGAGAAVVRLRPGMIRGLAALLVIAAGAGCGSDTRPKSEANPGDAGAGSAAAAAGAELELPRLALGADRLDGFGWRAGPGHATYRRAVEAEHAAAWDAVIDACRAARAADPSHLEAAWLEAAALARKGDVEHVLAPLETAAAGDWGKWGDRSIQLELFAGFRATPVGKAWERAAAAYRADYAAALGRAVIVGARGDLAAYDPLTARWLRVTRTYGAVRAAVALDQPARLVAYVAVRKAKGAGGRAVTVGTIDLATGRAYAEVAVAGDKLRLRFRDAKGTPALEVSEGKAGGKSGTWSRIDYARGVRIKVSDAKGAILSPTLYVAGDAARLVRPAPTEVTADWDDQGVAGAMRIERSRRTVTAPGTTLFDVNTLVWSPDRTRLAVVTAPAESCAPDDREVIVIDVDTGRLRSVDRAAAPAQLAWLASGELAVARGGAVSIYGADGTPIAPVAASAPLWLWVRPSKPAACPDPDPAVPDPVPEPDPDPIVDPEPETEPESAPESATDTAAGAPAAGGESQVRDAASANAITRDAAATVSTPPDAGR
jgi:hypothetical protein